VDLRWGITEEQANEGQVLPLCLAEIERSRPYFIGLLGERYGWIPDTIRPEVIARETWLKEHVQGRTSVTELEILFKAGLEVMRVKRSRARSCGGGGG
jgi:nephrocystin-3